jgi:hypothetical protein
MVLTKNERKILQSNAKDLSDYQIAKKRKNETPNVYCAGKMAIRRLG